MCVCVYVGKRYAPSELNNAQKSSTFQIKFFFHFNALPLSHSPTFSALCHSCAMYFVRPRIEYETSSTIHSKQSVVCTPSWKTIFLSSQITQRASERMIHSVLCGTAIATTTATTYIVLYSVLYTLLYAYACKRTHCMFTIDWLKLKKKHGRGNYFWPILSENNARAYADRHAPSASESRKASAPAPKDKIIPMHIDFWYEIHVYLICGCEKHPQKEKKYQLPFIVGRKNNRTGIFFRWNAPNTQNINSTTTKLL